MNRLRLVYIAAASHSGSTLLALLLGGQPDICSAGELRLARIGNPEEYLCSCGEKIGRCAFWSAVTDGMHRRGALDFSPVNGGTAVVDIQAPYASRLLRPLHRGALLECARDAALAFSPSWRKHLRDSRQRVASLLETLREVTGANVIVDSSKLPLRLKYLLNLPGVEVSVIRMVRDGRAVSLTYTDEWNFADASDPALRGGGTGEQRPPPRRNILEGAREWRRSNESADCLVARLPREQWIQVRYEDLCADTAGTLARIYEFLHLDPARMTLDFRAKTQHVVGNGMRLDRTSQIRLDDRWRQHLQPEALAQFEAEAGALNRHYGYN